MRKAEADVHNKEVFGISERSFFYFQKNDMIGTKLDITAFDDGMQRAHKRRGKDNETRTEKHKEHGRKLRILDYVPLLMSYALHKLICGCAISIGCSGLSLSKNYIEDTISKC